MATLSANDTKFARFKSTSEGTFNCFSDTTKGYAVSSNGISYIRSVRHDRGVPVQVLEVETGPGQSSSQLEGLQSDLNEVGRALRQLQEVAASGSSKSSTLNMSSPVGLNTADPTTEGKALTIPDLQRVSDSIGFRE